MRRILLIDSDMLAYRYAFSNEYAIAWDEDTWTYFGHLQNAKDGINLFVSSLKEITGCEEIRHYLSDTKANWRREIMPQYKGERAGWKLNIPSIIPPKPGPRRPMLWGPIRQWLFDEHGATQAEGLEGDDLLGIEATCPVDDPDIERVIVSEDKDMRTIPGFHLSPRILHEGIFEVSREEAARFHLKQTLMGDQTDGYKGIPGIGEKRADKILEGVDPLSPEGWEAVVSAYAKKGLSEEVALMTARVAHVLQWGEYDDETKEIKLWDPIR